MEKKFNTSLFIFRRDLRLQDNTGLLYALKHSISVIPIFIFTPEQIENNPYKSDHCLKFMIESIQELDEELKQIKAKLYLFKGKPDDIVKRCIEELNIDAIIVNSDYTPYSQERDKKLEKICDENEIPFFAFEDLLLHSPDKTLKKDGTPYKIFTPFFRNASKFVIPPPIPNSYHNYFRNKIHFAEDLTLFKELLPKENLLNMQKGGRKEALIILKNIKNLKDYSKNRDFPFLNYSSKLSPYLKFTVCSPREAYHAILKELGPNHDLIRSLYWRDFFTMILYFFPEALKKNFYSKFDQLQWSYDKNFFKKWCEGKTGFPIVDAGMREMNSTGFMHNRVRMIVASFLVKNLHIDWKWGEKYFAQNLIDYDPAVNNGNWQWVASTGCDAQPYFRIFNPWSQQKKFDEDCKYIKKWIPELNEIPSKVIHMWYDLKNHTMQPNYPSPIVDYKKTAMQSIIAYKKLQR